MPDEPYFSPGYLRAGYLERYAPLPVFIMDAWVAMFFYMLILIARDSVRQLRSPVRSVTGRHFGSALNTPHVSCLLSILLIVFGATFWARIQTIYVQTVPPTELLFLRQLGHSPFKGATFISNTYSAPIVYHTGTWAYDDSAVSNARYMLADGHVAQVANGKYLWEADRLSNPNYLHPQYYLCILGTDIPTAAAVVVAKLQEERLRACSDQPIVREAELGLGPFSNRVVAVDPSPRDHWAIIRIDPTLRMVRLH